MRKTVYNSEVREVVDLDTGEVGKVEKVKRAKITIDSEPFYMVFIDHIAPFYNLTNGTAKNVLTWLCTNATFNTGKISLAPGDRKKLCEDLDIKPTTLSNSLKELSDKKLIDGSSGSYTINPQVFWKGDLLSRNALLNTREIRVTFDLDLKSANIEEK